MADWNVSGKGHRAQGFNGVDVRGKAILSDLLWLVRYPLRPVSDFIRQTGTHYSRQGFEEFRFFRKRRIDLFIETGFPIELRFWPLPREYRDVPRESWDVIYGLFIEKGLWDTQKVIRLSDEGVSALGIYIDLIDPSFVSDIQKKFFLSDFNPEQPVRRDISS